VTDHSNCKTAKEVANIPAPNKDGLVGFEGSSVFIPAPVLRNAILASGTNKPFELIPIITDAARNFNLEHEENKQSQAKPQCMALRHQSGLNQQN
jgi:hypothetical protein